MSQKKQPARVLMNTDRQGKLDLGPWHQLMLNFDAEITTRPHVGDKVPLFWPSGGRAYRERGCVVVTSVRTVEIDGHKEYEVVVERQNPRGWTPV
jgi:hypothetical protein